MSKTKMNDKKKARLDSLANSFIENGDTYNHCAIVIYNTKEFDSVSADMRMNNHVIKAHAKEGLVRFGLYHLMKMLKLKNRALYDGLMKGEHLAWKTLEDPFLDTTR